MKKYIALLALVVCFGLTGCDEKTETMTVGTAGKSQEQIVALVESIGAAHLFKVTRKEKFGYDDAIHFVKQTEINKEINRDDVNAIKVTPIASDNFPDGSSLIVKVKKTAGEFAEISFGYQLPALVKKDPDTARPKELQKMMDEIREVLEKRF